MRPITRIATASALALAFSQTATAGTAPYFQPLTQSAVVAAPNSVPELNSPWLVPAGVSQKNLTSMAEIEADVNQSVQRVPGLGTSASMFDMLAFDPRGKYLFIPHETFTGAGVTRYNIKEDTAELIFAGDASQNFAGGTDFGAFDPARFTPNGTLILAEEWSGEGRVVEVFDPLGPAPIDPTAGSAYMVEGQDYAVWEKMPRVSHEGINFSLQRPNKVIYFVDEDRSGSIYKMVLRKAGNYAAGGQTFVLKADNFTGDVSERVDRAPNTDPGVLDSRFGKARWVPITDRRGNPLYTDPYTLTPETSRPGRVAADDAGGTPFGRPEDMSIGRSGNGNEMLYIATTSENAVISVEELGKGRAYIRSFASEASTPKNLGFPATTGTLNAPDNIAIDALGNIYIIEDAPNGSDTGGDIWFAEDQDQDGVAESIHHFMSTQVDGSEATGMIFNPRKPTQFVVAVQHPDSTDIANVAEGFGDALWTFDIRNVLAPQCADHKGGDDDYYWHHKSRHKGGHSVKVCTKSQDTNLVSKLRKAAKFKDPLSP